MSIDDLEFVQTEDPMFEVTRLPEHYRVKKALPKPFAVRIAKNYRGQVQIPDGTKVEVSAGPGKTEAVCPIKNHTAEMKDGVARFNDLRFYGTTGRGRYCHLTITVFTEPTLHVITVNKVIKVTADGPRPPRRPVKKTVCHVDSSNGSRFSNSVSDTEDTASHRSFDSTALSTSADRVDPDDLIVDVGTEQSVHVYESDLPKRCCTPAKRCRSNMDMDVSTVKSARLADAKDDELQEAQVPMRATAGYDDARCESADGERPGAGPSHLGLVARSPAPGVTLLDDCLQCLLLKSGYIKLPTVLIDHIFSQLATPIRPFAVQSPLASAHTCYTANQPLPTAIPDWLPLSANYH